MAAQDEEIVAEVFKPAIEAGQLETSMTLGFIDLTGTLMSAEQILYKVTDEAVWWGDVEMRGESAFNPILRLNYNLTSWFALEGVFNVSVSEYMAEITNRFRRAQEDEAPIEPDPPLGEFDPEHRSVITLGLGAHGVLYPFNFDDGEGRFHPFLMAGMDRMWFNLNTDYTDESSIDWNYQAGASIRFIADDLISVRFQVAYQTTKVQFTPSETWVEFNEGTIQVPVYEVVDGVLSLKEEFESQTISSLSWGIGFQANF
ncbi:MAG: hypothetical protein ABIF77_16255 [bacterium]